MDPVIALLRDLVAINSVNPTLVPGAPGERAIAGLIAADLRRSGLDVVEETVVPGRPNVVGVLEGMPQKLGRDARKQLNWRLRQRLHNLSTTARPHLRRPDTGQA